MSIVIENDDPETSSTGRWRYWTGREAHEGSLRYGLPGQVNTYRFTPDIPQSGQYRIYTQWLAQPEQSRQVDYDIQHSTGLDTVPVNQQQNGGQWNELGVFTLSAGSGNFVEISDRNGIYAIADVVRFDLVAAPPTPDPELCPKPVETELLLCRADLARIQSELGQSQIDLNDQIHRLLDIQGVLDR